MWKEEWSPPREHAPHGHGGRPGPSPSPPRDRFSALSAARQLPCNCVSQGQVPARPGLQCREGRLCVHGEVAGSGAAGGRVTCFSHPHLRLLTCGKEGLALPDHQGFSKEPAISVSMQNVCIVGVESYAMVFILEANQGALWWVSLRASARLPLPAPQASPSFSSWNGISVHLCLFTTDLPGTLSLSHAHSPPTRRPSALKLSSGALMGVAHSKVGNLENAGICSFRLLPPETLEALRPLSRRRYALWGPLGLLRAEADTCLHRPSPSHSDLTGRAP